MTILYIAIITLASALTVYLRVSGKYLSLKNRLMDMMPGKTQSSKAVRLFLLIIIVGFVVGLILSAVIYR